MKKIIFLVMMVMGMTLSVSAKDVITKDMKHLPVAARTMIKKHFPKAKLSYIKMDKDFMEAASFEVVFVDGTQIDFDKKGVWTEVDCKLNPVPAVLIPAAIQAYLKQNYPEVAVEKIERMRKGGYDVELHNDLSLRFDAQGNFVRIED